MIIEFFVFEMKTTNQNFGYDAWLAKGLEKKDEYSSGCNN
jgi:hypothetical protein